MLKQKPGSSPLKGVGEEGCTVVLQEAPERAKAEFVVARRGSLVAAVGDEELVLDPDASAETAASLKLSGSEKTQKLAAWLGTDAAP
jgi:hypothetical protein